MSKHPGMGVMIQALGGNTETIEAIKAATGKTISALKLEEDTMEDGALHLSFTDGTGLLLFDAGRSCCESRYMVCDDDLAPFIGATFTAARVQPGPDVAAEYDAHEVQFLPVDTSEGTFTVATHNEHSGYYGGFWISAKEVDW